MSQPNLFMTHHQALHKQETNKIGSGWEDTLTELFAFLLATDDAARAGVAHALLGDRCESVLHVETQRAFDSDQPDMVLRLASGRLLVVEHKVDAPLGKRQLERYLELVDTRNNPGYLALITKEHVRVPEGILANPAYLRPADRTHWSWLDIFRAIPVHSSTLGANYLRKCFLDYLEWLGLKPSNLGKHWGKLFEYDTSTIPIRKEFGRQLSGARNWFAGLGYHAVGDSHSGFQASPEAGSPEQNVFHHVCVGPTRSLRHLMDPNGADAIQSEVLRMALVFDAAETPAVAERIHLDFPRPLTDPNGFEWWPVAPYPIGGKRTRLECVCSLQPFLRDDALIGDRLTKGCIAAAETLLNLARSCVDEPDNRRDR